MNHDLLMKRCIDLGKKALGKTYPNPNVGALLFYDGKIISEGFTQEHGKNHAEINAIKKVNDREILKKSTLYVTLEPCSHYGKTPPCCEAIYKKEIRKVVIGINDPNKLVNGRGIMEVVEYMNSKEGHGSDPSRGIGHKDSYALTAGDVILVESGDYVKVVNESDHDQLTYLRVFDREGWRQ